MAASAEPRQIVIDANGVMVRFADRSILNFASLNELKMYLTEIDSGPRGTQNARMFALAWWLARDPDGSNPAVVLNKLLTLDLSAANPIRVQ